MTWLYVMLKLNRIIIIMVPTPVQQMCSSFLLQRQIRLMIHYLEMFFVITDPIPIEEPRDPTGRKKYCKNNIVRNKNNLKLL